MKFNLIFFKKIKKVHWAKHGIRIISCVLIANNRSKTDVSYRKTINRSATKSNECRAPMLFEIKSSPFALDVIRNLKSRNRKSTAKAKGRRASLPRPGCRHRVQLLGNYIIIIIIIITIIIIIVIIIIIFIILLLFVVVVDCNY